ncbi:hypothetical protein M0R45_027980 [Rubus argutus]|uniref:Uncharacterized protein n=1 Tax=Rubus argutus TaxID=59490 RepID=A0AAW1W384_RUBAR
MLRRVWLTCLLRDTCPFRPLYRLTDTNFTQAFTERDRYQLPYDEQEYVAFFDCSLAVESPYYIKIDCTTDNTSSSSTASYSYIMLGDRVDDLQSSCNMTTITLTMLQQYTVSFSFIRDELRKGYVLSWSRFLPDKFCYRRSQSLYCFREYLKRGFIQATKITGWSLMARMILGIIVLLNFLGYKLYWKKFLKDDAIEKFSNACNNLMRRSDEMDIEEASILPQSESATELNSMV